MFRTLALLACLGLAAATGLVARSTALEEANRFRSLLRSEEAKQFSSLYRSLSGLKLNQEITPRDVKSPAANLYLAAAAVPSIEVR